LPIPAGPPAFIVHSPLPRCSQTAAAVATAMTRPDTFGRSPDTRPDDAFRELNQGAWEGLTHDEIVHRFGADLAAWRRRPAEANAPGGESLADADARLRPSLGVLLAELAEGREPGTPDRSQVPGSADPVANHPWAIVIGHDGIFKLTMLALFGMPLERFWSIAFPLAGITIVELRAGRPVLRAHGLTDHLAPLALGEEEPETDRGGAL
jgi:broad specificity phosphatase PhoE